MLTTPDHEMLERARAERAATDARHAMLANIGEIAVIAWLEQRGYMVRRAMLADVPLDQLIAELRRREAWPETADRMPMCYPRMGDDD